MLIIIICSASYAFSEEPATTDHRRIADDIKFENARHFYDLKLYDKSLRELNEYLEIYMNGSHRKEAFWTAATIYFNRFNYEKAAKNYNSLYEEFSSSEEGVRAYYRTGICYLKMGYDEKAAEVFKSIMEDYPNSEFASQSRTQLDLMDILQDRDESIK